LDNQLQTFIELSTLPMLADLADDQRPAWVWSADGARILWANAAGAAFFNVRDAAGLARLSGLERSPARPHIARIATSGPSDRMSIDRLRFYRGLRVMLLTCQCQRLALPSGHDAALIICGDKGVALTTPPLPAYLDMLAGTDRSVFVLDADGDVVEQAGSLSGTPVHPTHEDGLSVAFSRARLNDSLHDAVIARLDDDRTVMVLDNDILEQVAAEPDPEDAPEIDEIQASQDLSEENALSEETEPVSAPDDEDDGSKWVRADELFEDEEAGSEETGERADVSEAADAEEDAEIAASDEPAEEIADGQEPAEPAATDDPAEETAAGGPVEDVATAEPAEDAPADEPARDAVDLFEFEPRRRPVRFAWKMDIDQRFTFLSDEFADVLGPETTDIVGQTWEEVARKFALDPRGQIARALDRRDTWSGKTVDWPVSGADLRVPVDMAALPAFDRNRKFEGYRGFGVCRSADATQAPAIVLSARHADCRH
jgi:hypothetical protein